MQTFIPFEKLSKKEKKKINSEKRRDWNGLNPSTRVVPNKKAYNRKKKNDFTEDI